MNIQRHNEAKFLQIYTSDSLDKPIVMKKDPSIVFIISNEAAYDFLATSGLLQQGIIIDNKVSRPMLVISSARKVVHSIEILCDKLMSQPEFKTTENELSQLNEYKKKALEIQNKKSPKQAAPKSRKLSHFEVAHEESKLVKSTHGTEVVKKKDSPASSKKRYIKKNYPNLRSISEIEAFNASCYRLLLGNRHPKVRALHGENGERLGIVSEMIPSFITLDDYLKSNGQLTVSDITKSDMMKVWVAAYIEEEFDLHTNNYGFNKEGLCVKIDDDRSTWRLTAKYMGVDPEREMHVIVDQQEYNTAPIHAFKVTAQEINSLPVFSGSDPFHWIDKQRQSLVFDIKQWTEVAKLPSIIDAKFYLFLKRILIPNQVYEELGKAHIGSNNTRKKFVDHKIEKTAELKNILLAMPEFQVYVHANHHIIQSILNEFGKYNQGFKKSEDSHLHIHLGDIQKEFQIIYTHIQEKMEKINEAVLFLSHQLESNLFNFNHHQVFETWCKENLGFTPTLDTYYEFQHALYGRYGEKNGLLHGDSLHTVELLRKNEVFFSGLIQHMDTYEIKSWQNKSLQPEKKLDASMKETSIEINPTKSALSTQNLFNQKSSDLKPVVDFLIHHFQFFSNLLVKRPKEFNAWVLENFDAIIPMMNEINGCFQKPPFTNKKIETYFEEAIQDSEGNLTWNESRIYSLLESNVDLLNALKKNMDNPIINKYYEDKM